MAFNNPLITDFQNYFYRDFPYGIDPTTTVTTTDIGNAFIQVNVVINPCLFPDQTTYTNAYLYCAAHFLVMMLRASTQGINGQFNFLQSGKGVGSVNESFSIPPRILENPIFAIYTKTHYGLQYLFLLLPQLSGQMFSVCGTTLP